MPRTSVYGLPGPVKIEARPDATPRLREFVRRQLFRVGPSVTERCSGAVLGRPRPVFRGWVAPLRTAQYPGQSVST
jgi:hypothetical protein